MRALAGTRLSALSRSGCALTGFPLCGRLSSRRGAILSIRSLWSAGCGPSVWSTSGNRAIDAGNPVLQSAKLLAGGPEARERRLLSSGLSQCLRYTLQG